MVLVPSLFLSPFFSLSLPSSAPEYPELRDGTRCFLASFCGGDKTAELSQVRGLSDRTLQGLGSTAHTQCLSLPVCAWATRTVQSGRGGRLFLHRLQVGGQPQRVLVPLSIHSLAR